MRALFLIFLLGLSPALALAETGPVASAAAALPFGVGAEPAPQPPVLLSRLREAQGAIDEADVPPSFVDILQKLDAPVDEAPVGARPKAGAAPSRPRNAQNNYGIRIINGDQLKTPKGGTSFEGGLRVMRGGEKEK